MNSVRRCVLVLVLVLGLAPASHASGRGSQEAVALFLTKLGDTDEPNMYWNATRVMVHWLKRDPVRCTCRHVVVLVTHSVPQWQIQTLLEDGVHVVPVRIPLNAKIGGFDRWAHNMAKLHLWNLMEYSRILYFDSDFMLFKSPDEIFRYADMYLNPYGDEWVAGAFDWAEWQWDARRQEDHLNYINAGLLLLKPNTVSYDNMISNLKKGNNESFTTYISEQDIINHYFGGTWPNAAVPTYRGVRKYRLFPHSIQRQHVNDMQYWRPDTVTVHIKAWESGVAELRVLWNMAIKAVEDWDTQKAVYARLQLPVPEPVCGSPQCRESLMLQRHPTGL